MSLNDIPITVTFSNPIITYADTGVTPFASRLDQTYWPILYAGEALPGTDESFPLWRIWKVTAGAKTWAGGVSAFTNRWTERLDLIYS